MESRIKPENAYPDGLKTAILVSLHANNENPPVKVISASSFERAADVARGIIEESRLVYFTWIWHCRIPIKLFYRAGGIIVCSSAPNQPSREGAGKEAGAKPVKYGKEAKE